MGKRAASSPMKSAKKAKVESIAPKIKNIDDVLTNSECEVPGPEANRTMLSGALPHALGTYSDERHGYQTTVAKMIGEVLKGWVVKWEKTVADSTSAVQSAETEKVAAGASHETAVSSLAAQKEAVKTCKEALKAATDAEKAASATLAGANSEVKDFDAELQAIIAKKDHISTVYEKNFLIMKTDEAVTPGDSKSHIKDILAVAKEISAENSLQIAIVPALKKKPAERGDFDKMAIDGVENEIKTMIGKLSGDVASADSTKATKEATAAAAKTEFDALHAKREECKAALKASQDAQEEKEKSLTAAEKNLEATSKGVTKAEKDLTKVQHGLDLAKGSLANFQYLLERTTPPPTPPPVEEAEATPAA